MAPDGTERWYATMPTRWLLESGLVERRRYRAGRDRARAGQPAPRLDPPFAGNAQPLQRALVRLSEEPLLLREVCRLAVEVGSYRMAWVGYAA